MKILKKVTFINSADMDYFEMDIDGHAGVYGQNNSGKTTVQRAVLFGEHGSRKAMNFTGGEDISYYFHNGSKPGFLVYDYIDRDETGFVSPYCLIISSTNRTFVSRKFNPNWLRSSDNKRYHTEWKEIYKNIEAIEGPGQAKIDSVASLADLEKILQGTADKDYLRPLVRHYALFDGKPSRPSGAAQIIQTQWKNKQLGQDEIRQILVERVRASATPIQGGEILPDFPLDQTRSLAEDFIDGFSDYEEYRVGRLRPFMNETSEKYADYLGYSNRIEKYPIFIASVLAIYKKRLEDYKILKAEQEEKYCKAKNIQENELNNHAARVSTLNKEIGALEEKYNSINDPYQAQKKEYWEKAAKDIADYEKRAEIHAEALRLEKDLSVLNESTKEIDQEETLIKAAAFESRSKKQEELNSINKKKQDDKKIEAANNRSLNVKTEVQQLFKERQDEISNRYKELTDERKRLEKQGEFIKQLEGQNLAERFLKEVSFNEIPGATKNIVIKLFDKIARFVAHILFDVTCFTMEEHKKEQLHYNDIATKYKVDKTQLENEIKKKEEDIIKECNATVEKINKSYNTQIADINSQIKKIDDDLIANLKDLKRRRNAILENAGINPLEIAKMEKTLKEKNERYSYLIENAKSILNDEKILADYATIDEVKNNLEGKITEKQNLDTEWNERKKTLNTNIKSAQTALSATETRIKEIEDGFSCIDAGYDAVALESGIEKEHLQEDVSRSEAEPVAEEKILPIKTIFEKWGNLYRSRRETINEIKTHVLNIQRILSPKDFFNFSIKPNDSLSTDKDFLRVAKLVSQRNDIDERTREIGASISYTLTGWHNKWNQLLRQVWDISIRLEDTRPLEETVNQFNTFLARNNTAHSIEYIRLAIDNDISNPLIRIAVELKEYMVRNNIDINSDITGRNEQGLFVDNLSEASRKRIVDLLKKFSQELAVYDKNRLEAKDMFVVRVKAREEGKTEKEMTEIKDFGSNGTSQTLRALLSIGLVGSVIKKESRNIANVHHIIIDEFAQLDAENKASIIKMLRPLNLILLSGEPQAQMADRRYKYGYSLDYDKKSRVRRASILDIIEVEPIGQP